VRIDSGIAFRLDLFAKMITRDVLTPRIVRWVGTKALEPGQPIPR